MFINKEGKLFGKISFIDILVVVAVVVLLIGGYTKFKSSGSGLGLDSVEFEYTMVVKNVRGYTFEALKRDAEEKTMMTDAKTRERMGRVQSVTPSQAYFPTVRMNGSFEDLPMPDKLDVTITVRTKGKMSDVGCYTEDNKLIGAGTSLVVHTKYASTTAVITEVRR